MALPLLSIRNIAKNYATKTQVIRALVDVSFDIFSGQVVSLLGANGAGKTTLSSIIATLHPPTSGDILFNGKSIYDDIWEYRKNLGFCPQKPNFEKMLTIEENLIFAGRYYLMPEQETYKRVTELLQLFELTRYAKEYPSILSGGYKQRLLIARALIHNPRLVILDEPTVALDPHIRRQLWDLIRSLKNSGIAVLITTHYLDEAEALSDKVVILDKGIVKLIDHPENLKSAYAKTSLEEVFIQLLSEQNSSKPSGE